MNNISLIHTEQERVKALKLYDVLDTLPEQEFDDLTRLASEICNTPIALISLIDEKRQWFKSNRGLDINETSRDISFCSHAIQNDDIFEVPDPRQDSRFLNNPLVTGHPNIRFYAGAPLINKDGYRLGTICVINSQPQTISDTQKESLRILARSVISLLELRKEKKEAEFYKKALDEVSVFAVLDENLNYEYVNQKFCDLAEMPEKEILGRSREEIGLADESAEQEKHKRDVITGNDIFKGKVKNQGKNGSVTWSNLTMIPLANKDNEVVKILSVRNDITTEVLMVERLEEAEKVSKTGNWEFNLINGSRYWSRGVYAMMGFSHEEDFTVTPSLFDFVCPADKERIDTSFRDTIAGKDVPNHSEFKVLTKKQKVKDLFVTQKKRFNNKGVLIAIYGTVQDITERKAAEKAINESYLKINDLYNNAPCGYHSIDTNGVIIDINDTELKWMGYTRDEVVGKLTLKDIFDGHLDAAFEEYKRVGYLKDYPRLLKCKDGTHINCIASASALYDDEGAFVSSRTTLYDITEMKQIQDKLEESEAKYRSLVEESAQMAFTTDLEGRFTYASTRLKKTIGYEDEDILGKQFAFIYDDEWKKKTILFYIQQINDEVAETKFLFPIKNKDGEKVWVEQTATLIKESNKITGFTCVLHDVTERIKAEEAMQEAARLATEAKDMQENFLSRMSHEIRTPMNGVVGMVNLLGVTQLSEKQIVYVDGIKESAVNMLRIINDILDVTKIQAGKMIFEETDFELAHLINNVILTLTPAAELKNVLIASHIDNKIPTSLIADPVRLNQILLNLSGNALKFTEEGSVIISVAQKAITENAIALEFKVKDTGIGIAPEKIDSIFESFTQAESDTTRKYGGTGLGLTIAKQLVEQQKGEIKVESKLGRGTTFSFTFHCKLNKDNGQTTTIKKAVAPEPEITATSLEGRQILLVEDNVMNQRVARFTLENWGVVVTIADRGYKALELLKTNVYDVILMDIQMPEMNGMMTTEKIRQELKNNTPVIAMTASAMRGEREKCITVGMNDYISKPFEPEMLYKKILSFVLKAGNEAPGKKVREKIINLDYLTKVANNDIGFLKEILEIYMVKIPVTLKEIDNFIIEKNFEQLFAEVHNLKNSVGFLGATALYNLLIEVEMSLADFMPSPAMLQLLQGEVKESILDSLDEAKNYINIL